MQKQTKLIKFMLCILLIIPIVLFTAGVVQTFVLKARQKEYESRQEKLIEAQEKQKEYSDTEEYMESDEYNNEYNKHENGKSENPNDVIIEIN